MSTHPTRDRLLGARFSRIAMGQLSGRVQLFVLGMLMMIFVGSGYHLYSVNQSAVQGYHIRSIEKEINALKQENTELKITEADLRSLYRIEAAGEELRMEKSDDAKYLEARGPVAMR